MASNDAAISKVYAYYMEQLNGGKHVNSKAAIDGLAKHTLHCGASARPQVLAMDSYFEVVPLLFPFH